MEHQGKYNGTKKCAMSKESKKTNPPPNTSITHGNYGQNGPIRQYKN